MSEAMKVVSLRLPREVVARLRDEAARFNEPVSRTIRRHLDDYDGWTYRDGAWDFGRGWSSNPPTKGTP